MQPAFLRIGQATIRSELTGVVGQPGVGTYRLGLVLEWSPTRYDEFEGARMIFGGDLHASFANDAPAALAQLQPIYPVVFPHRDHGTSARLDLAAQIGLEQLEALETHRSGGPIKLHLKLQGAAFWEGTLPGEAFWQDLVYHLRPSDWLEVLEHWHYAEGFLIQVPRPKAPLSSRTRKAVDELTLAVSHMSEGRPREAVAACRDVLELAYSAADRDRYPELEYRVSGIEQASKDERFWLARRGLWAVAHAGKHRDDTTDDIKWERRDAKALISMVGAVLEHDPPD